MSVNKRKIINDPVYGFITIDHPLIFDLISHPYYQRLRRIHQMALAHLVYPGAVHTRLHHSLGAYHLMCQALQGIVQKGAEVTPEEDIASKAAILLHDIGHGPFSHTLEHVLLPDTHHEEMSLRIMEALNDEMDGQLTLAIKIFKGEYHKPFLHQLISGQLDMDRMDYLSRDSFFTGVSEGIIGYDRILKMLSVKDGQLVIEEKGIHSVEKFLIARRQMFLQVYLHKTVLAAEKMLVKIIERVRSIFDRSDKGLLTHTALDKLLEAGAGKQGTITLKEFCSIDDVDVLFAIKKWSLHEDIVLSTLSRSLLERKLFKCILKASPIDRLQVMEKREEMAERYGIPEEEAKFFAFTGEEINTTYKLEVERINILFKNGEVKDISKVDNPLINQALSEPVKKFYFCYMR